MRKFSYQAKDQSTGKTVSAEIQADSERSAAKVLLEQGYTPLMIKEQEEGGSIIGKLTGRITTKDKVVFTRQLATLIGAGLPMSQSLRTVLEQTENKRFQAVVQDIISLVEGGKPLTEAFSRHPEVFDKVYIALISAGEASGTLDTALQRIADQQEKDAAMMSKIRGALVYPVIVLLVIIGVMCFMLFTVVPQVEGLYQGLHKELPWITQMMVNMANFLIKFWWVVVIVLVAVVFFLRQYLRTASGIRAQDLFKLNVPIFGKMFRKLYMARFSRTGQTLLSTGVAMLDMLRISSDAVNNTIIAKSITRAADKVKGGKALSTALEPEDYVMRLVPQMIKIGEQSGKIDEMMGKAAKVYEDELEEEIKSISTAIEPVLMVFLAIMAGGMVAAILLPIYSLVNTIQL